MTEQEFWRRSLALYEDADNQQRLIELQDSGELNVNLALLCQCLDEDFVALADADIQQLHDHISNFNLAFTSQLRSLRRQAKTELNEQPNYPNLRNALLTTELEFEKIEQRMLVNTLQKLSTTTSHCDDPKNLARYCRLAKN